MILKSELRIKSKEVRRVLSFILLSSFILISYSLFLTPAQATEGAQVALYMESEGFSAGQSVARIDVFVDANVPVNAYSIAIIFDERRLAVERVDTSGSIVTILQEPIVLAERGVTIIGASQPPFSGSRGKLFSLIMRGKAVGEAEIGFILSQVYQADGNGTLAVTSVSNAAIVVGQDNLLKPGVVIPLSNDGLAFDPMVIDMGAPDSIPPEITRMSIEKNPFEEVSRLLVFTAVDDRSSVIFSKVRTKTWFSWSPWQEAVNPYALKPNVWAIQLEVTDGAGNSASATMYTFSANALILLALLIITSVFIVWIRIIRKRRKKVVL